MREDSVANIIYFQMWAINYQVIEDTKPYKDLVVMLNKNYPSRLQFNVLIRNMQSYRQGPPSYIIQM